MTGVVKTAVIGALQRLPSGQKPHLGDIRKAISHTLRRDVTSLELRQALEALYFKGMIDHKLNLSPSMREPTKPAPSTSETEEPPSRSGADIACGAVPSSVAPVRKLIDLRHAPSGMEAMAASWRTKAVGG